MTRYICIAWAAHTHTLEPTFRLHILSPHAKYRGAPISFDLRPRGVFSAATHIHTNSSLPGTAELKGKRMHGSEKWADAAVAAAGEEAQVAWQCQWAPPPPLLAVMKTEEKKKRWMREVMTEKTPPPPHPTRSRQQRQCSKNPRCLWNFQRKHRIWDRCNGLLEAPMEAGEGKKGAVSVFFWRRIFCIWDPSRFHPSLICRPRSTWGNWGD